MTVVEAIFTPLWSALAGAGAGAYASWLFTRKDRERDSEERHRAIMTAHFSRVIEGLGRLDSYLLHDASKVRDARREVLTALMAARLDANDAELGVTVAARDAVQVLSSGPRDSTQASLVGAQITAWWRDGGDPLPVIRELAKLAYDDQGNQRPIQV